MKSYIAFILTALLPLLAAAQPPDTLWTRTYGARSNDYGYCVQQTADGGYIIAGTTIEYSSYYQVYLIKTDVHGNQVWQQTYGGDLTDWGYSVQQTSDGGYIIAGKTHSFMPSGELYLVKTDGFGNQIWQTYFGGTPSFECGYCVQQTTDGGYIVTGETGMFGPSMDAYLVKTNAVGALVWQQGYGGDNSEEVGRYVCQTLDGGYIITGFIMVPGAGGSDILMIKTDYHGNLLWQRTFGSVFNEYGFSVQQTTDGGYIIAGDTGENHYDVYVIKTDSMGHPIWQNSYGGINNDFGRSVQQTLDGGYIVAGYAEASITAIPDVYLLKIDTAGNLVWQSTFGGAGHDYGYDVRQTQDCGYIVAGYTDSFGADNQVYLIKTEPDFFPANISLDLIPFTLPILIPASGGSFSFYAFVSNEDSINTNVTLWTKQILPDSTITGPILGPFTVSLPPGTTGWLRHQNVPGSAPPGEYKYIGYAGIYPNTIWSSDTLIYTKLTTGSGPLIGDWANTGESFDGEWSQTAFIPSSPALVVSPNPFNPTTAISFKLQAPSHIRLAIWDTAGRLVTTLVGGWQEAGAHDVTFDGSNLPSGVYLYRLTAGQNTASGKMVLLK